MRALFVEILLYCNFKRLVEHDSVHVVCQLHVKQVFRCPFYLGLSAQVNRRLRRPRFDVSLDVTSTPRSALTALAVRRLIYVEPPMRNPDKKYELSHLYVLYKRSTASPPPVSKRRQMSHSVTPSLKKFYGTYWVVQ